MKAGLIFDGCFGKFDIKGGLENFIGIINYIF